MAVAAAPLERSAGLDRDRRCLLGNISHLGKLCLAGPRRGECLDCTAAALWRRSAGFILRLCHVINAQTPLAMACANRSDPRLYTHHYVKAAGVLAAPLWAHPQKPAAAR